MSPDPLQPPPTPPPPPLRAPPSSLALDDPPPPYPARERRARGGRRGRRATGAATAAAAAAAGTGVGVGGAGTARAQQASGGTEEDDDGRRGGVGGGGPLRAYAFPLEADEQGPWAGETTPLLLAARQHDRGRGRAQHELEHEHEHERGRTISQSSTVFSGLSASPSFAQTVASAFRMEMDSDGEEGAGYEGEGEGEGEGEEDTDAGQHARSAGRGRRRWRRYFRPMGRGAYWAALFHLLVINFPYALVAAVFLFVFTLLGTTLLVALPLGAVLCFFDLLGARTLARGEVLLQETFHGPLAYELEYPLAPIFTRRRAPTTGEVEGGLRAVRERSFYRNTYSMFTDPTSYQALFYFLVIKPSITLLLSLLLAVVVPVSLALVLPAPWMLRLVRRLGLWQANVAVEGLYMGGG